MPPGRAPWTVACHGGPPLSMPVRRAGDPRPQENDSEREEGGSPEVMSRLQRLVLGAAAVLGIVVPVSAAWACVAPVSLTTVNPMVQPGGVVRVVGRETAPGAPIEIHLDAVTGPLLTTVTGQ